MTKKTKITIMIVLLVILLAVGGTLLVQAVWDSDDAVHIVASDIENSTMIIGTHLVHISALNDDLYDIALDSVDSSGQVNLYYKSEMAGGVWYDITSARTLADISTDGSPVTNDVIEALFFEYHTKSDGITYDLRTGEAVCIFDITDPYDLSALPELEPLKYQYELLSEKTDKNDVEDWCEGQIRALFSIDFTMETAVYEDDITGEEVQVNGSDLNDLDENMAQLQWFLDTQNEREMDSDHTGVTTNVMSAIDAERRLITMRILHEKTFELQNVWMGTSTITARPEDYVVSVELTDAISSCLDNISDSTIEHTGNILSEGTTTISAQQYYWKTMLVNDSLEELQDDCDYDVEQLLALDSLLSGDGSLSSESEELITAMVEELMEALVETLEAGETVAYETAVANGETETYLESMADTYESTITQMLGEIFYLEESLADTMSTDEASAYLADCIADTGTLYNSVASDAFEQAATNALDAFMSQLTDKLTTIVQADSSSELDLLAAEKADLQTEYMECLDNSDLDGAKEIAEEIAAIDDLIDALVSAQTDAYAQVQSEIAALEDDLANTTDPLEQAVLNDQLAAKNAEAASLESQMSSGDMGNQIIELRDGALDAIVSGDVSTLENNLLALGSLIDLNYTLVFPAVEMVYEALLEDKDLSGFSSSYSAGYLDGSAGASYSETGTDGTGSSGTGTDTSGTGTDTSGTGTDTSGTGTDTSGTGTDTSGTGTDTSGTGTDTSGTGTDTSGTGTDTSGTGTDTSGTGTDTSGTGTDTSGTGTDTSGTGTDTSGTGSAGIDTSGAGSDGSDTSGDGSSGGVYVYEDAIEIAEEIILNNQSAYAASVAEGLSADDALAAICTALDLDPDMTMDELMSALDQMDEAAVIAGLGEYLNSQANPNLEALAKALANQAYLEGNPMVYQRVDDPTYEYIPLNTLSYVTGLRYYWNNTKSAGILAKGTQYYAFSMFYDMVQIGEQNGEKVKMNAPTDFKTYIHVPEEFTAEYFGCQAVYLKGTDYGVAVSEDILPEVEEIVELLFQGGF